MLPDTIHIKEIVVRDNKFAGGKVEFIDTVVLKSKINLTLADVLSENTTVFINSAAKGSVATASMRGAGASHTKVMWGNLPVNSPMTGQVDFSLLPVFFADEVSINYGSAALVNTGGALGGSIIINNKPEWNKGFTGKIGVSAGSFGTYSTQGQLGWSDKKIVFKTRLFFEQSKNDFEYFNNTVPEPYQRYERQQNADYYRYGLLQEIYWRVTEKSILKLNYWYQDSERNIPELMNNTAPEHDEKQLDVDNRGQLSFKHYSSLFNYEISTGFLYAGLDYYLKNKPLGNDNFITNIESQSKSYSSITKFKTVKKWSNNWEFDFNIILHFDYAEFTDIKNLTGYNNNMQKHSVFAAVHKKTDKWKLSAMIRQELIDDKFIKPIPSVGAEYIISDKYYTSVKANISRNYHNPTLNQLYFMPGGNPDLRPEQGTTAELSLKNELLSKKISFTNEISTYYSVISDWILWKPSQFGYWTPENTQLVYSRGIEYLSVIKRDFGKFKTKISAKYAFTPTTNESPDLPEGDESKGEQLIYIPKHSVTFLASIFYKKFYFVWQTYYIGNRNTTTATDVYNPPLPYYWLSGFSVGKELCVKHTVLNLQFKIDNLFNVDYQSIQYRAMPGINCNFMINFVF